MSMAQVTNTGSEVFEDGYAGIRYTFAPGKKVAIPFEAAVHIFGHRQADKDSVMARLGWATTRNDMPEGLKKLAKFKIEDDGTHHSLSPVVERVPLQSHKGSGGKLTLPEQAVSPSP